MTRSENSGAVAKLTANEKEILEELFQMRGGYVLNFSDRTFGEFFRDDIGINIFQPKYNYASVQAVPKQIDYVGSGSSVKVFSGGRSCVPYLYAAASRLPPPSAAGLFRVRLNWDDDRRGELICRRNR